MIGHVDLDLADRDGAFDTHGDMVGIIGYPYSHFFPAFEHRSFDEQGFEFDRAEFGVPGADGLLPEVTHIEMIDLAVEEHSEVDLVAGFVVVEVDIPGVEGSAEDVLDAIFDGVNAGIGDGCMSGPDEGDVLIGLVPAFVDIADELVGLQSSGIKIAFVFIADLEQEVVIALAFGDDMVTLLSLELLEACIECRLTGGGGHTGQAIIYFVREGLPGLESRIADTVAKITAGAARSAGSARLLSGVNVLNLGIPGHYWKG